MAKNQSNLLRKNKIQPYPKRLKIKVPYAIKSFAAAIVALA